MNKKLYVGNLPFSAQEAKLQALFSAEGRKVVSVRIPMDQVTGRSKGFAFVEMATFEDADKAVAALHGFRYEGRALSVSEVRADTPRESGSGLGGRARPGSGKTTDIAKRRPPRR